MYIKHFFFVIIALLPVIIIIVFKYIQKYENTSYVYNKKG